MVATSMGVLALILAGGVLNASLSGQMTWPRLQQGFAALAAAIAVGMLARATD